MIDSVCASAALSTARKGTLARYSSFVHWHLKRGVEPGTLKVT
jgi:hypothetical protein